MCTSSTTVAAPSTPDVSQTAANTLQAQIALAPQEYGAVAQYAPQYQDLLNNLQQQGLYGSDNSQGLLSLYQQAAPQLQTLQSQLNAQQAGANIGLVGQYGQQATQAFQQANPQLQQVQSAMTNLGLSNANPVSSISADQWSPGFQSGVTNALSQNQVGGQGTSLAALNQSAQGQLALGGQLSPQEMAQVSGGILANYNQQGRANDPTAIAGLATGLDTYSQALLQERQNMAANAAGLTNTAQTANLSGALAGQGLNYQGLAMQSGQNLQANQANQAAQQFNAQYQAGTLGQAGNLLAQTSVNPFAAILGQSGAIGTTGGISGTSGAAGTLGNAQSSYNPFNIATSLYGNYTNQLQNSQIANANTSSGILGGLFGLGGSVLGAAGQSGGLGNLFGTCVVAREVFGADNPRWLQFRSWLMLKAPAWFRWLYIEHGPRFAEWIHDKPRIKALIRRWMNRRIATIGG